MAISRADLLKELLPGLERLFGIEYEKAGMRYSMKFRYGKYSIYRNEYSIELQRRHSTTLAKGLDKHTAIGSHTPRES